MIEALWARMTAGTREDSSEIAANDPHRDVLTACAADAKADPRVWLKQHRIHGNLRENARFAAAFAAKLWQEADQGCRAATDQVIRRCWPDRRWHDCQQRQKTYT